MRVIDIEEHIKQEIAEHFKITTDDMLNFKMTGNEVSFILKQPAEKIEFTVEV